MALAKANSEAQLGQFKGPHPVPGGGRILQVRLPPVLDWCRSLLARTCTAWPCPSWASHLGPWLSRVVRMQSSCGAPCLACHECLRPGAVEDPAVGACGVRCAL